MITFKAHDAHRRIFVPPRDQSTKDRRHRVIDGRTAFDEPVGETIPAVVDEIERVASATREVVGSGEARDPIPAPDES